MKAKKTITEVWSDGSTVVEKTTRQAIDPFEKYHREQRRYAWLLIVALVVVAAAARLAIWLASVL